MERSVLVVEDSPDHADLFASVLRDLATPPWRVETAGSLKAAVDRLERTEFDAVLVDLHLPDSAGAETIDGLSRRFPQVPLVAMSAHVDDETEDAVIAVGADDLLAKHRVNADVLVRALRRAIRRKDPARQLAQSEHRFEAVFRKSPVPMLVTREAGEILDVNDAFVEMFGYARDGVIGRTGYEIGLWMALGDRADMLAALRSPGADPTPEIRVRARDGRVVTGLASNELITLGGDPCVLGTFLDITDRVEAERALRASEARFRSLIERGWTALTVTAADGRLTYASPRCREVLGHGPEDLVGKDVVAMIAESLNPEDVEATMDVHATGLARPGAAWSGVLRVRRSEGGESAIEYSAVNQLDDPHVQGVIVTYRDITEVRAAEQALRASERLFKGVFDGALEAIVITDDEGVYTEVNPAACELFGVPAHELRGRRAADFAPPGTDHAAAWATFREQGAMEGEYRLRLLDGTFRYVQFAARANVLPGRHLSVMRDITAEKAAEEALRRSEERYRGLFERSRAAVYQREPAGTLLDCNPAFVELFGFPSREAAIGSNVAPLWESPDEEEAFLGRLRDHQEVTGYVVRARTLGGEPLELVTNARLLDNGVVEGNAIDVTSEMRAAHAAERQRVMLESVVDAIPAMLAFFGPNHSIRYVNRAWQETLGWSLEEAQRIDILAEMYPDPALREQVAAFIEAATGKWGDFPMRDRQGRVRETSWANVALPDGGNVGIGQDVTERRNLEAQLRQAQKMEALGRLAGGVAHDFNNVLTAILGYSEMMQRKLPPESPFLRNVGEIRRAGERAAALVRQLLAFSRNQPFEKRVLSLRRVIEDVAPMLRRVMGEHIELDLALDVSDDYVFADASQLEQVVLNLAVNGRDAMPHGGRLTVTSRIEAFPSGRSAVVEFRDSGPGIPPEALGRVFEPFFTTKPVGQGTGLGLATVFGIIAQLGGTVMADNPPGGGARFTLMLPLVARGEAEPAARETPSPAPRGHETILLVEDEDTVRSLAREVLEVLGYNVLQAAHPRAALQLAETGIHVDLVLTDVIMPELTGPALVARLRQDRPRLRAVYMSGYTGDVIGVDPDLGPEQLLQKPFSSESLARRVRAALDA